MKTGHRYLLLTELLLLLVSPGLAAQAHQTLEEALADPEFTDHFGVPDQFDITIGAYGSEITMLARAARSILGPLADPGRANSILGDLGLFRANRYGHEIILAPDAFGALLEELSDGAVTALLEAVFTETVPASALIAAAESEDRYVVFVYFDRMTYAMTSFHPDESPPTIDVSNPAGTNPADFLLVAKAFESIPASAIDRWEIFRIVGAPE